MWNNKGISMQTEILCVMVVMASLASNWILIWLYLFSNYTYSNSLRYITMKSNRLVIDIDLVMDIDISFICHILCLAGLRRFCDEERRRGT